MFSNNLIAGAAGQASGFYPVSIDQSLRFNDNDSAYLSRTPASAGNRKTWTWSGWVKRAGTGTRQWLFSAGTGSSDYAHFMIDSDDKLYFVQESSLYRIGSSAKFRDHGAWYHMMFVMDTTNATANDRMRYYVNGERVDVGVFNTQPPQNTDMRFNQAVVHTIGKSSYQTNYADFYLAEVHFTDGTAYDADAFGELKSGVWVAKTPSVTYGTNGFYLDFANSADIGNDISGEGNDWTPNNFTANDVMPDSPTLNFATMNPLQKNGTLAEGNLKATTTDNRGIGSTMHMTSGKWYWEICPTAGTNWHNGVIESDFDPSSEGLNSASSKNGTMYIDGRYYKNGVQQGASGVSTTTGDVIGITFDASTNEVKWYKNNVYIVGLTLDSGYTYQPATGSGGSPTVVANFGQDSSFAGTKTAQGNSDENGYGDFYYTPPSGFLALCTANLPEPTISPANDASPEDYFNTVLYSGDNTSPRSITGVGFDPEFVWVKNRTSGSYGHYLWDVVRGTDKNLRSDGTFDEAAVSAASNGIVSTNTTDGFIVKAGGSGSNNVNGTGGSYVAWNWKANGSGVSNTDGSITSTVSANTTSGFSIVTYTGTRSSDGGETGTPTTIGHGLGKVPAMVITKARESTTYSNWNVWHQGYQPDQTYLNYQLWLNLTSSANNAGWQRTDTGFSTTTFCPARYAWDDVSGIDYVAYVFAEIEGFSKFGSYTGNGSTDGPFVYTGFRPAFVMIKRTDSATDWQIGDATRDTNNLAEKSLQPNQSYAEGTVFDSDFLSNGFKLRNSGNGMNASGGTYIYMAFAENPFKYSNAR